MANINYDDFEKEIDFIKNGKHLKEASLDMGSVNPAFITKKQQIEKKMAMLQADLAKAENELAQIEKAIALDKAADTRP